jgi:hypothetical protein
VLTQERRQAEEECLKVVEKIEKEAEVQRIIETHVPTRKKIEDIVFVRAPSKCEAILGKYDEHISHGGTPVTFDYDSAKRFLATGIDPKRDANLQEMSRKLKDILHTCWSGVEPSAGQLQEFKSIVAEQAGRDAWSDCFNIFRIQGHFSWQPKAFTHLADLINCLLDQLIAHEDVECALRLLILAQSYYVERTGGKGKPEKMFLQHMMHDHPFWQREAFWEKTIRITVQEDLNAEGIPGESQQERAERIQHSIFGKLGTHAHNMLQFTFSKEKVEALIIAHAKAYSLPAPFLTALHVPLSLSD